MIYLDHNASRPPTTEHLQKLFEILNRERPANPSSPHALGRAASVLLSQARRNLAAALNIDIAEIIFTSGGTEANNLGTRAVIEKKLSLELQSKTISIITTAFEHPCVLKPLEQLKQTLQDQLELIVLQPNENGYISIHDIISNIKPNTVLISIMAANNEIGTVQPVKKFGDFLNFKRWGVASSRASNMSSCRSEVSCNDLTTDSPPFDELSTFLHPDVSKKVLQNIHFHVDAVQIFGKIRINEWMSQGYDSLALSGHKLGALQGVGAFILRRGHSFLPLIKGGAQEKNRRAGTENIPGIISFGMVCEDMFAQDYWHTIDKMQKLTHILFDELLKKKSVVLNSSKEQALPNTVHFSLLKSGHSGEDLILNLDMQNVFVSSGSACSSGVNLASHVVLTLGKSKELALNSIRISLGTETTLADIHKLLNFIP